jgi:uncharacterized membrane-anchored protein YhcB (DUF1043 family)
MLIWFRTSLKKTDTLNGSSSTSDIVSLKALHMFMSNGRIMITIWFMRSATIIIQVDSQYSTVEIHITLDSTDKYPTLTSTLEKVASEEQEENSTIMNRTSSDMEKDYSNTTERVHGNQQDLVM